MMPHPEDLMPKIDVNEDMEKQVYKPLKMRSVKMDNDKSEKNVDDLQKWADKDMVKMLCK